MPSGYIRNPGGGIRLRPIHISRTIDGISDPRVYCGRIYYKVLSVRPLNAERRATCQKCLSTYNAEKNDHGN